MKPHCFELKRGHHVFESGQGLRSRINTDTLSGLLLALRNVQMLVTTQQNRQGGMRNIKRVGDEIATWSVFFATWTVLMDEWMMMSIDDLCSLGLWIHHNKFKF
jgi:hypothetical protein